MMASETESPSDFPRILPAALRFRDFEETRIITRISSLSRSGSANLLFPEKPGKDIFQNSIYKELTRGKHSDYKINSR